MLRQCKCSNGSVEEITVKAQLVNHDTIHIMSDIIYDTYLDWEDYILKDDKIYECANFYTYQVRKMR